MSNIRVFGPLVHEKKIFLNSLFLPLSAPYGAPICASPFDFCKIESPCIPQRCFLPKLVEISSVVLEKKSFK